MAINKIFHNKAYFEARLKIEEARRSEAIELDLGTSVGVKLTELPETLWRLPQLQKLSIASNQLTAIPESISQLSQLRSLDLYNNELKFLPKAISQLSQLQDLNLSNNQFDTMPETIGYLTQLQSLDISSNQLTALPELTGELNNLEKLNLGKNLLTSLPECVGQLTKLRELGIFHNPLGEFPFVLRKLIRLRFLYAWGIKALELPDWIDELKELERLVISDNYLTQLPNSLVHLQKLRELVIGADNGNPLRHLPYTIGDLSQLRFLEANNCMLDDLPPSISHLEHLERLEIDRNPLNPELSAAYSEGLSAVKAYLRAKAEAQITLHEAKLILVGEGEVGKTCLMDALEDKPWQEHPTTHGIKIRSLTVFDKDTGQDITLNGWDFGGQRVYRPTHQLFFSSPAVYLVVWKPREGPQQGFVREWIKLIKHREPEAKILVVATHGGPQQRQPDIDRQEIWDLFSKETVLDFFFVDSKPDENGQRRGVTQLKEAIARIAINLPEMGRSVPKSFQEVRQTLLKTGKAYLPLEDVYNICRYRNMDDGLASLYVTVSHRLGHLIHYEHDPSLRDIVILKPDWLTTAVSFVLDNQETRQNHGLVSFEQLTRLWQDPEKKKEERYEVSLHRIFLRLMERYDLSYRVAGLSQMRKTTLLVSLPNLCQTLVQMIRFNYIGHNINHPATANGYKFARLSMNKAASQPTPRACSTSSSSACTATRWAAPTTMTASTGSAA